MALQDCSCICRTYAKWKREPSSITKALISVPRERGKSLRQSLEQSLRKETIGLLPYMSKMQADPNAFVLRPSDQHPNRRGLELYADAVARALLERGLLPQHATSRFGLCRRGNVSSRVWSVYLAGAA